MSHCLLWITPIPVYYYPPFGVGGFFIIVIVLLYFYYRKRTHDDIGCLILFLLPFWALIGAFGFAEKLFNKSWEKLIEFNALSKQFDLPPSRTLKVMMVLTLIGLWIMGMILIAYYDSEGWLFALYGIGIPFVYAYLYILWKKLFFVWLTQLRPKVATVIVSITIVLIIIFWILAIRGFIHVTSIDYYMQYLENKYQAQ